MGKNFRETLNEQLKDPEFKAEWDALEPEFQIMKGVLFERTKKLYELADACLFLPGGIGTYAEIFSFFYTNSFPKQIL